MQPCAIMSNASAARSDAASPPIDSADLHLLFGLQFFIGVYVGNA